MQQVSDFHEACREIVAARGVPALNYAVGYAQAGLTMASRQEIQVQCLYILNNIQYWRGPKATQVRETFKQLSKPEAWKEVAR